MCYKALCTRGMGDHHPIPIRLNLDSQILLKMNKPWTYGGRSTPRSSGPCELPQHDKARSGDAAHCIDWSLRYFPAVQVEFDLEMTHSYVHLANRQEETCWTSTVGWFMYTSTGRGRCF